MNRGCLLIFYSNTGYKSMKIAINVNVSRIFDNVFVIALFHILDKK